MQQSLSEWLDEIGGEVAETLRLVDSELKIEKSDRRGNNWR